MEVHVRPGSVKLAEARDAFTARWKGYPIVEQQQYGQLEVVWNPGDMAAVQSQATPRLRFWRGDKKRLLQASAELFAANDMLPEPGWDELEPMFRQGFSDFVEIMHPDTIIKGVVRYINRIELPENRTVGDMFSIFPTLPGGRASEHAPFQMVVDMGEHPCGRSIVALAFAGPKDRPVYVLEIVVESLGPIDGPPTLFQWAETAHGRINELFDTSITETARKVFGERGK